MSQLTNLAILTPEEILIQLKSSQDGLSSDEAKKRLSEHGSNLILKRKKKSLFVVFLDHLKDWFSILLLFASLLSFLGDSIDLGIALIVIVIINNFFSIIQEKRAEKAMEALKNWVPQYTRVIRNGNIEKILVSELIPGDLIFLEEGDRVPADARIIESYDVWVNNIPLTGESEPQPRNAKESKDPDISYIDAPNLLFMSTSIVKGQAKAVVFATGMDTKFGGIANLTLEIEDELSPLQKEIANTAKLNFFIAVIVGGVFFSISFFLIKSSFLAGILFFIGVMVACVPEGLQVTVSSALAINVLKMTRKNVLVKKLSSIQTLGSVTSICTDKTGTITRGEMTVRKIWLPNKEINVSGVGTDLIGKLDYEGHEILPGELPNLDLFMRIISLSNSAKLDIDPSNSKHCKIIGDPTDGALLVVATKFGLNISDLDDKYSPLFKIPFDSKRKRSSSIHDIDNKRVLYAKGAPYEIFTQCNNILTENHVSYLSDDDKFAIEQIYKSFAARGMRVIGVAYKEIPSLDNYENFNLDNSNLENNMVFVGLAIIMDPPRPEVKDAIKLAKQAGIKITIISGDSGSTAQAISEEVGITEKGKDIIIRGQDFDKVGEEKILKYIQEQNAVFARVSPEQKLRVIRTLKQNHEIVAVTGDGANDAPSLRESDIGVAMGLAGTDIAKEAADIILLDDSFASIVNAIESGRVIYENIRKFIIYVFSHNWAELIPYVLYILLNIPLPLLVSQILAIDLFIDIIPSLALSREPPEPGIMQEPPRSKNEPLFNFPVLMRSIYIGLFITAGALFGCLHVWISGGWHLGMELPSNSLIYIKGTTMTFAGIVIAQIGNLISCRTKRISIFKIGLKSNITIIWSILFQVGILAFVVYAPPMQLIFGTTGLNGFDWLYLFSLPFVIIGAEELRKLFFRINSKIKK